MIFHSNLYFLCFILVFKSNNTSHLIVRHDIGCVIMSSFLWKKVRLFFLLLLLISRLFHFFNYQTFCFLLFSFILLSIDSIHNSNYTKNKNNKLNRVQVVSFYTLCEREFFLYCNRTTLLLLSGTLNVCVLFVQSLLCIMVV